MKQETGWIGTRALLAAILMFGAFLPACAKDSGPTGPGGDECTGLKGGDPVGRWSNQKTPAGDKGTG